MINLHVNAGLSGKFRIVKHKNGEKSQELEFDNLILDAGLDRWGVGQIIDRCFCGSGTTAPAVTDVSMGSLLATSTSRQTVPSYITANSTSRWTEVTTCYRFAAGTGTGTWYEIGMGWAAGLFSRTLIKDGSGNPTSITKLSDETVDVFYTLRVQFPASDITGSITLEGVAYDYILRPASIGAVPDSQTTLFESFANSPTASGDMRADSVAIGSVTATPPNASWGGATTATAYTAGSYTRRLTFSASLSDMNVSGGFKSLGFSLKSGGMQQQWQIGFYSSGVPAAIPKTDAKIFSLTMDFSWARGS